MARVLRVTVLCPYGRRETINLTPNSSILQILEEACRKQNINPDDFDLCHYNKPLDLSLPVRFANLPNNAQLELQPAKNARKDCLVTVGLQLESGGRIMKDFVPSTTVSDVVEECLKIRSEEVNLDEKGEPVCVYMRQKLVGDAIKSTTLRSLGLTKGSAIIRLMYRNPEDLYDQAHVSSPLNPKEKSVIMSGDKSETKNEMTYEPRVENLPETLLIASTVHENKNVPNIAAENQNISFPVNEEVANFQSHGLKTEEPVTDTPVEILCSVEDNANVLNKNETVVCQDMEIDNNNLEKQNVSDKDIGTIHYIGGRHAVLYSLNDITEVKKADFPDEFFELTIQDVRYLMEEYKRTRHELENQPLLTKELRKQKLLQKLGAYKQTVIRVYFPERLVLQAVFQASETVQDVCEFIRDYMEDKSLNFYLYTAPPKEKKDPTKSLIELMLIPAAVVYFGCDSYCESYLMSSLKDKISDPQAASLAAYESRKQTEPVEAMEDSTDFIDMSNASLETPSEENKVPGPSYSQTASLVQSSGKVPKWLKLSKK